MKIVLGVAGYIAFLGFALAQFIAAYAGIQYHLGTGWAWTAIIVAFTLRFTLPITIGAFFGAMDVWGWHWTLALLFALPGLAFVIPGVIGGLIGSGVEMMKARRPH